MIMESLQLQGKAASTGMALGQAARLPEVNTAVPHRRITADDVPAEKTRLSRAFELSREELSELTVTSDLAEEFREIFEAQILFLEDPMLVDESCLMIERKLINAEWAFVDVLESLKARLSALENQLIRERVADLEDIGNRVIANMMDIKGADIRIPILQSLPLGSILIADDVSPSLMLHIREGIGGIVTEHGGVTGHMVILARNRDIPVLVGVKDALRDIKEGDEVLLEADEDGILTINPDQDARDRFAAYLVLKREEDAIEFTPAVQLADGRDIYLWVNLNEPGEVLDPKLQNVTGVGLFRTEFIYLKNPVLFASVQEQADIYASIMEGMGDKPVVFRLLDVGDDKTFNMPFRTGLDLGHDSEHYLRGMRFLLAHEDLLISQLTGIMYAMIENDIPQGRIRLMLPMITVLDELIKFKSVYFGIREKLANEFQVPYERTDLTLGIMLETPAACLMVDVFSKHCEFFSLGTNDLARCVLAADSRVNLQGLDPFYQPSVFRLIKLAADNTGLPLTICGEMASLPGMAAVLVGLGVRGVSVARNSLGPTGRALGELDPEKCRKLAEKVLGAQDAGEVRNILRFGV